MQITQGYTHYTGKHGIPKYLEAEFNGFPITMNPFSDWRCPNVLKYSNKVGDYLDYCADSGEKASAKGWTDFYFLNRATGTYDNNMFDIHTSDFGQFMKQCKKACSSIRT